MKKMAIGMLAFAALASCKKQERSEPREDRAAVVRDTVTEPAGGKADSSKTQAVQTNAMNSAARTSNTATAADSTQNNTQTGGATDNQQ